MRNRAVDYARVKTGARRDLISEKSVKRCLLIGTSVRISLEVGRWTAFQRR